MFYEIGINGGEYYKKPLQRLVRYYASNKGVKLIKHNNEDHREIQLISGKTLVTVFNKYIHKSFEDYDVDINYYLTKVKEEIVKIEEGDKKAKVSSSNKQLTLF